VAAAVKIARDEADAAWARERPAVEGRRQPEFACKSGCSWCCRQMVSLAPAEAATIARFVRNTFKPAQIAALRERLKALDEKSRGLGVWGRAKLKEPCAFLVDGACSIYEARPLRCRGLYSRDAEHCRWIMDSPDDIYSADGRQKHDDAGPFPVEPLQLMEFAVIGLSRALHEFGLDWNALELTAAMRIALDTPDVEAQYAAGRPVLADARLPERDDTPEGAEKMRSTLAKPSDSA
jgi:hypothetical protein